MKWNTQTAEIKAGPLQISIEDNRGDHRWQYFTLTFGSHTHESAEKCLRTWPREAIERARAALDSLEAKLDEDTDK